MVVLQVERVGNVSVLRNLRRYGVQALPAIDKGLGNSVKKIFRGAFKNLSGSKNNPGGDPVPIETGHLRLMLGFILPGRSKTLSDAGSKKSSSKSSKAAKGEAFIINAAAYSAVIHGGEESSKKFGPREYILDAFDDFGGANAIGAEVINQFIKLGRQLGLA